MCSSGKFLKLCTCSSESTDPNSMWTLYRGKRSHPIVGSFMPPQAPLGRNVHRIFHSFIRRRKLLAKSAFSSAILTDLNSQDVFDFEFSAQDGDILMITFKEESYNFRFSQHDGWTESADRAWTIFTQHSRGGAIVHSSPPKGWRRLFNIMR